MNMNEIIKSSCLQLYNSLQPVEVYMGRVVSVKPIKIAISERLVIPEEVICFARGLTDFYIEMTENPKNRVADDITDIEDFLARKKYAVYASLKVGEYVILIRKSGGQRFIALDRVGDIYDTFEQY